MRMLSTALAVACTAGALVTGAAAPASANHDCPDPKRALCFLSDAITIPVGTPALGPVGAGPLRVPGPRLCDSTTGECTETFVNLPGAYVSSAGVTVVEVTIPAYGIVIQNGVPTVYYGIPSVGDTGPIRLGVTIEATVPVNVVEVAPFTLACGHAIRDLETVQVEDPCTVVVHIEV